MDIVGEVYLYTDLKGSSNICVRGGETQITEKSLRRQDFGRMLSFIWFDIFLHFMAWDDPYVIQGLQLLKDEENRSLYEETIDNASIPGGQI